MSYDGSVDTIFNPAGDPLPLASGLFTEPGLERGHSAPFGKSDGLSGGAAMQQEVGLEGDPTQGPARRARVAHLPRPAGTETKDDDDYLPMFSGFTEQAVAQELFTSEAFDYWDMNNFVAPKELPPSIGQTHYDGIQEIQSNMAATTKEPYLRWEDLSLGVQWIIILHLCEKQPFEVVVFSQLRLHSWNIDNFIATYLNFRDEWNAFERAAFQRSAELKTSTDMEGSSLTEWIHIHRPPQPIDQISSEDAQKGLRFLRRRGVNHNINFQEWVEQKDFKNFTTIDIEKPILQDCMDHLILRRALAANAVSARDITQAIGKLRAMNKRDSEHDVQIRGPIINDAFLGTVKDTMPSEDNFWCNPAETSSRAQAVMNTISADLRIDPQIPTPVSQGERQRMRNEVSNALRRLLPDLKPQYVPGLLAKTQWEADNGYPMGHVADYDLTNYTAEMQSRAEGQAHEEPSHAPISLRAIAKEPSSMASGDFSGQASDISAGELMRHQTESPAAYAAALASKRNASRPRIGAARSRFMTSNDKGQLMVGMAADPSSAAAQTSQNPGFTTQPAEGVFRTQLDMSRRAMEAEPANLPGLRAIGDFEPENVSFALERSQRARRPSARARESLQYALEMAQKSKQTKTTTGKCPAETRVKTPATGPSQCEKLEPKPQRQQQN
ncbi:hypothetical protein TASIC1_0008043200 [Trichoderma asperellum]|uniref:Uncharacterized protein n=1 Tax=Trichoderma asperellum TaxID=101201 RepID=A0A6V8QY27_TRIAP|nr:hypothetical protein TASIC1_0008043200 [Trichoderma asperellum]